MSQLIGTDIRRVILGLGKTGFSMAAFLAEQGRSFQIMDTRAQPPYADAIGALCPPEQVFLGGWQSEWLQAADELYVSPGVPLADPEIAAAIEHGARVVSDVELYRRHSQAEIVAVTGSNGKSTVVSLLHAMARESGVIAAVGGNIGTPVLDLLKRNHDVAILELSSFQLEMLEDLNASVAMVLNISPDHMDRYPDMAAYRAAKHRIFEGSASVVVHDDDPLTQPLLSDQRPQERYALSRKEPGLLSLHTEADGVHFYEGLTLRHRWPALRLKGRHNQLNILAALGAAKLLGWSQSQALKAVAEFPGLPHRCQWVAEHRDIAFINDSKGTNVGATLAALEGLSPECPGRLHLLAGGDGKGARFDALAETCARYGIAVYTFGRDGQKIAAACTGKADTTSRETMDDALIAACEAARPGDWILLSPACASLDQYANFEARGDAFVQAVSALVTADNQSGEGA